MIKQLENATQGDMQRAIDHATNMVHPSKLILPASIYKKADKLGCDLSRCVKQSVRIPTK